MPNRSLARPAAAGAMALTWALTFAAAGQPGVPYRVVDLPVTSYSYPRACWEQELFVSLGDRCVFFAEGTPEAGRELWVSDGTSPGTRRLLELDPRTNRDLFPYGTSNRGRSLGYERAGVRRAAFIGFDELSDVVVDTDGTAEGTSVTRLPAWNQSSLLGAIGGQPVVWGRGPGSTTTLHVVTPDGPRDITPPGLASEAYVTFSGCSATHLYFRTSTGNPWFWRTDGTREGTEPLITPRSGSNTYEAYLVAGDRLFVTNTWGPMAVWTLDPGSTTFRVLPAPAGSTFTQTVKGFAPLPGGDSILIGTREGTLRCDLSDLSMTPFLTGVSVMSPPLGEDRVQPGIIESPAGPRTVMAVSRTGFVRQYWFTDGTPEGSGPLLERASLITLGSTAGRRYFADGGVSQFVGDIWVTDGTPAGTTRLARMDLQNSGDQLPYAFSAMAGDRLVVRPRQIRPEDRGLLYSFDHEGRRSAIDGAAGFVFPNGTGARPVPGVAGDLCVFAVGDFFTPTRLLTTRGPSVTVAQIGPDFRNFVLLGGAGGLAWFTVGLPSGDIDLWRTDGTEAGTVRIATTPEAVYRRVAPGGDGVLLSCAGLYTSDGTPGSLRLLAAAGDNGTPYADPSGRIYHAVQSSCSTTLSTVDPLAGTATALVRISEMCGSPRFTSVGAATYLSSGSQASCWRTLGSPQTTTTFADGATLAAPTLGAAGGRAIAALSQNGAATLIAEDPATGAFSTLRTFALVDSIATFGENAVFLADDGEHGLEPWITDGTPEGTHLIAETAPGPRGAVGARYFTQSRPDTLFVGRDRCYFLVADDVLGAHAWCTDGTAGGTRRLARLPDDLAGLPLEPASFLETPAAVYFTGWTPARGSDLYAVRLCDADFTCDGLLDFLDALGFAQAFEAGTPDADFNGDGFVDFFDYGGFVEAFERGC